MAFLYLCHISIRWMFLLAFLNFNVNSEDFLFLIFDNLNEFPLCLGYFHNLNMHVNKTCTTTSDSEEKQKYLLQQIITACH